MSGEKPSLIPKDASGDFKKWSLPKIDNGHNTVAAQNKGGFSRRRRPGEIVEEVPDTELEVKPVTAQQLQSMVAEAEAEGYQRGHKEGFENGEKEGREEGLAAGKEQAYNDTKTKLEEQYQRLETLIAGLLKPIEQQDSELELLVLDLVTCLTEAIVKREMLADSSHIVAVVREALSALPVGSKHLTLYLNPDDLALVETYAEEQGKDWKFTPQADLLPGGCVLETACSRVDHSVEKRIEVLVNQLLNKQLGEEQGGRSLNTEDENLYDQA